MGAAALQGPVDQHVLHVHALRVSKRGHGHIAVSPREPHPAGDRVRSGQVPGDPQWGGLRRPAQDSRQGAQRPDRAGVDRREGVSPAP